MIGGFLTAGRSTAVTHLILDDDCVSVDPSVAEYDRRDVSMRLESQGADGVWGPDATVAEGETARARLRLDQPICEDVEIDQRIRHSGSSGGDFSRYHDGPAQARLYWDGAEAWTRTLPAGQATLTSGFDSRSMTTATTPSPSSTTG